LPGDARTIYYLGKEHMELIGSNPVAEMRARPEGPGAYHLKKSLEFYKMRSGMEVMLPDDDRVDEERYWAMLKAAEICERWLYDSNCCLDYWGQAWKLDPPRADAPFYIGQHYRLRRDGANAVKYLRKTKRLVMPHRNNYQWPYLYECLRHVELVRAGSNMVADFAVSGGAWKDIKDSYSIAMKNCPGEDTQGLNLSFNQAKARRDKSRQEKKTKGKGKGKAKDAAGTSRVIENEDDEDEEALSNKVAGKKQSGQVGIVKGKASQSEGGGEREKQEERQGNRKGENENVRPKMVDENGNLVDIPTEEEEAAADAAATVAAKGSKKKKKKNQKGEF